MHFTPLFYKIAQAKSPIVVNQGGSSSSKTISHLQLFYLIALKHSGKMLSVCSESIPHLKKGAMRDFKNILSSNGIWDESCWNSTDKIYTVKGVGSDSFIEFFSVDNAEKARGPRRDYLYMNEADRLNFDSFLNLEMRTNIRTYIDFNPVREFWYHDHIKHSQDYKHEFIQSTYKDNDTLNEKIVKSIENLKNIDENKWRVFGLGELGFSEAIIYKNIRTCDSIPESTNYVYGLDFGYNDPTALVRAVEKDGVYYVEQLLFESHLTNNQLIERLKALIPNKTKEIFADSSRPEQINEIRRAGFNIHPAKKDIEKGIDSVRTRNPFILKTSTDLIKEKKNYMYKTNADGKVLEDVVDMDNHLVDAERYAIHTWTYSDVKKIMPMKFGRPLY